MFESFCLFTWTGSVCMQRMFWFGGARAWIYPPLSILHRLLIGRFNGDSGRELVDLQVGLPIFAHALRYDTTYTKRAQSNLLLNNAVTAYITLGI